MSGGVVSAATPESVGLFAPAAFTYTPTRSSQDSPPPADAAASPEAAEPATPKYGAAGSRWWTIGGAFGTDFSENQSLNVHGAYSYFLVDDVEFSVELAGWYYAQERDDAAAINPALLFRWHFVNTGDWTVYADVGIGLYVATDDVPDGGTSAGFTPRAGLGVTKAIGESGNRLQFGVRWHHASNGHSAGDDDNPGLDQALFYAGFIFPF